MMVEAVRFEGCNVIMKKPEGMTDKECGDLPVYRGECDSPMGQVMVSCWKLTEDDFDQLITTGCVYLWVYGNMHPPVSITTFPPVTQEGQ